MFDAHNAVVETAVALGVVGLAIAGILVALVCARARGPLAIGALGLALSWLLQPMGFATFPLALLLAGGALSAANGPSSGADEQSIVTTRWPAADRFAWFLVPGLAVALAVGAFDVSALHRYEAGDSAGLAALVDAVPDDGALADTVAQSYEFSAKYGDAAAAQAALSWRTRATDAQPDRSRWWFRRALLEGSLGDLDAALVSVDRALALEPNSWTAIELKMRILDDSGDTESRDALMPLACALAVPSCEK
jgi:tetratricopeptide (TPR) repeat protein